MTDRLIQDAALYRKITWRLLPFLMICYAVAYPDRINVGIAKLGMSHDLGLSEAVFGAGAGIFFVGYFFFEVPSNALLHRVGARVWIARIMISWAIASGACAFVQGPTSFYIARFVLGVTEAGFYPGVILYLTYWYPSARRGQIIAFFMTAIPVAGLVGTPLSGFLMSGLDGGFGWAGWRWMILAEAVPALLLGMAVPFVLTSRVSQARWLTEDERKRVAQMVAGDRGSGPQHAGMRQLFIDPQLLRYACIYFCCVMGQYGITFWLPTLVRNVGEAPTWVIGLYAALPYGCAVVSMLLVGRSSDRRRERRWHLVLPMMIGAAALAMSPLATNSGIGLSLVILCIATAAVLTATPLFWNLPTAALSGMSAALGIAAINSVGNLAGFFSPMLVGWLADRSGSTAAGLWAISAVLVVGALFVLLKQTDVRGARPSVAALPINDELTKAAT